MNVRRSQAAFTLVELMVSAALLAGILGAAYICLSAGVWSQRLIESRADAVQSGRVALALLAADLRCARPLSADFALLGLSRRLGETPADNLDFATQNYEPREPGEADFCEVSYFLDRDRESGELVLWRRRDATLDPEPLSGGSREEIARGVRGLRFQYFDGWEWFDTWGSTEARRPEQNSAFDPGNLYGLPQAVRVWLWLDASSRPTRRRADTPDPAEPPLLFQTVVRLELASAGSAGVASAAASQTAGPGTTPPAPNVGGRN